MIRFACVLTVWLFAATGVQAETVGIATTPPGSFMNSAGTAIATVVVRNSDIEARVQPQTGHIHNAVQAGAAEFGIDNYYNILFAGRGTELYEGQPPADAIMLAARIVPLQLVLMVRADSNLRTVADLADMRVPTDYGAQRAVDRAMRMYLATEGLTYDDVRTVPVQNVVAAADAFRDGRADVFLFALGAAKVQEVEAATGGLRVLKSEDSPEAVDRARDLIPSADPLVISPGPGRTGVQEPTTIYGVDVNLIVNRAVPDDVVYAVVRTMYEHADAMAAIFPPLASFEPKRMGRSYPGVGYHPGALRFFEEVGIANAQ